jgi:hypothetical protein
MYELHIPGRRETLANLATSRMRGRPVFRSRTRIDSQLLGGEHIPIGHVGEPQMQVQCTMDSNTVYVGATLDMWIGTPPQRPSVGDQLAIEYANNNRDEAIVITSSGAQITFSMPDNTVWEITPSGSSTGTTEPWVVRSQVAAAVKS